MGLKSVFFECNVKLLIEPDYGDVVYQQGSEELFHNINYHTGSCQLAPGVQGSTPYS
jgi:hypothetical protein